MLERLSMYNLVSLSLSYNHKRIEHLRWQRRGLAYYSPRGICAGKEIYSTFSLSNDQKCETPNAFSDQNVKESFDVLRRENG